MFAQSHVTAHAEAAWLLSAVTSYGQLGRMTQFKEKADRKDFVSAGLFTYPVLMAGDILLYQADIVPIGDDQRQHLELSRDMAERFNTRFGETFIVPQGVYPEVGARIMDLQEPTRKMSTTGGTPQGTIGLLDPPDVVRKKFRSAVTDSGREVQRGDDKPGVSNLIDILSVASGRTPAEIEAQYGDGGYGQFKQDVGEAVVELLAPVQERYAELRADEGELLRLLALGADKARAASAPTLAADVRGDGVRAAVRKMALITAAVFARRHRRRRPPLHRRAAGRGLRPLGGRARRRRVGDRDRDRVGRREVRPRGHRRAPVDARQPARALHRHLLAQRRRARRGAVLDPRLAVRERAARARARDRGRAQAPPRAA